MTYPRLERKYMAKLITGMSVVQYINCKSVSAVCSVGFAFNWKLSASVLLRLKDWDSCLLQKLVSAGVRVVAGNVFYPDCHCMRWRSN